MSPSQRQAVLNSILFTNEILFKIGYIPSPNCSFCQDTNDIKDIKPSISHFERILEKKYETEKYIAYKSNRIISFRDKWKPYEELFLSG